MKWFLLWPLRFLFIKRTDENIYVLAKLDGANWMFMMLSQLSNDRFQSEFLHPIYFYWHSKLFGNKMCQSRFWSFIGFCFSLKLKSVLNEDQFQLIKKTIEAYGFLGYFFNEKSVFFAPFSILFEINLYRKCFALQTEA